MVCSVSSPQLVYTLLLQCLVKQTKSLSLLTQTFEIAGFIVLPENMTHSILSRLFPQLLFRW